MQIAASLLIFTPVLLPLERRFGLEPIHLGTITVLDLVIDLTNPFLGVCLFDGSGRAGNSLESIGRSIIPFTLAAIVVPPLNMYIPVLPM